MSNILLYEPFYDVERVMDEILCGRLHQGAQGKSTDQRNAAGEGSVRCLKPKMDLHENKDKNCVTACFELPGMDKKDIDIQVQNCRLCVTAECSEMKDMDTHGYAVRERRFGKYMRMLQLPEGVKEKDIKAKMENGLLTITFPKVTETMEPKKIQCM